MAEYIKRADVLEHFNEDCKYKIVDTEYKRGCSEVFDYYKKIVENAPIADVVEVVRCKNCKYYEPHGNGTFGLCKCRKCKGIRGENDYCSYGERKEE